MRQRLLETIFNLALVAVMPIAFVPSPATMVHVTIPQCERVVASSVEEFSSWP